MENIYDVCLVLENDVIKMMQTTLADAEALLLCYGDQKAVPFFNADNCDGDTFYYPTLEKMTQAIKFWCDSYRWKYFVRWTVTLKETSEKIGTIEMFNRGNAKGLGSHGVLRIDLRSQYETKKVIENILEIANEKFYDAFGVDCIVTKAIPTAAERIRALESTRYEPVDSKTFGMAHYYGRKCVNQ